MSNNTPIIVRQILQLGLDDWMYFAEVVGIVQQHCEGKSHEQALSLTLDVLQEMFDRALLVPGDLIKSDSQTQSRFAPWSIPSQEWNGELQSRLLRCQNNPRIGDVCWFATTHKGEAEARENAAS
jgi:hypothetical protein